MSFSVHDLSWKKTSFLAKLLLFFKTWSGVREKFWSDNVTEQAAAFSALSSTEYSIAGTAKAHYERLRELHMLLRMPCTFLWLVTWLPLGGFCYLRMLPHSDKVVELLGYEDMSADQCDIRQSILRARGKWLDAKDCCFIGLKKKTSRIHTRGLLYAGLADVYRWQNSESYAHGTMEAAVECAKKSEQDEPEQTSRIYKQCARVSEFFKFEDLPAAELRRKAEMLARPVGAHDQLLKQ